MSYQENRVIAYLVAALISLGIYTNHVLQQVNQDGFESATISSSWGTAVLIAIGVQVVLSIIVAIAVSIIQAILMDEADPDIGEDERDNQIELRADRISYIIFGGGFFVAMITLAVGMHPLVMFNLVVYSIFGAGIAGCVTQLVLYRRGF